jgi:hypothetical protein
VTSEELELSLKTDFENYFKETLAAVRQDVNDFQRSYESEFAKHKSQMDDALRVLSERIESGPALDKGFTETVIEHLRLARDEGARLTATAFSEAEKLQDEKAAPEARYDLLRTAVDDISNRKSQADILGALIEHSSNFAPRGVFFIVKSEQFAAWRSFGDSAAADQAQSVSLPVASDTILAAAVNGPSTSEGSYGSFADDEQFLGPLELGRPDRMYAIPLTARGRGVAVLYVDYGIDGLNVNVAALETLVRVAGLTVELRAAAQSAAVAPAPAYAPPVQSAAAEPEVAEAEVEMAANGPEVAEHEAPVEFADAVSEPVAEAEQNEIVYEEAEIHPEPMAAEPVPDISEQIEYHAVEEIAEVQPVDDEDQPEAEYEYTADAEVVAEQTENYPDPAFQQQDTSAAEVQKEAPYDALEPVVETNGHAADEAPRRRFGSRDIDLPIEVTEDERKYHTNARRFARLLVSEIKLYNEQKVTEGRESGDLYDRLREAIDRSREMYDKRVEPQVAAKFDYFHYEILNDLADGDVAKLGNTYPGAVV